MILHDKKKNTILHTYNSMPQDRRKGEIYCQAMAAEDFDRAFDHCDRRWAKNNENCVAIRTMRVFSKSGKHGLPSNKKYIDASLFIHMYICIYIFTYIYIYTINYIYYIYNFMCVCIHNSSI